MSKALPLTFYPTKSLQEPSRTLTAAEISDPKLLELIEDMAVTMKKERGIGLAAPQIGRNIRLCIIDLKDGPLPLLNPVVVSKSWRKETELEGCLSIPKVFGMVKRSRSITVKAVTPAGKKIEMEASGLLARVIQHEVDHLDGILFIERTKDITEGKELLEQYVEQV